jgi:carboxypeptidase T
MDAARVPAGSDRRVGADTEAFAGPLGSDRRVGDDTEATRGHGPHRTTSSVPRTPGTTAPSTRPGTATTMAPMSSHRRAVLAAAFLALSIATPAATAAAEPEFPSGDTGYHTYAEMAAEVAKAEADHPAIVDRFSIGTSHQGRELWAVKISDDVGTDESEPEVLFDGLHHGDEHMSLEMTLAILRWLTDGYGSDDRVTRLVDSREIWIVFAVNPDGATYDIAGSGGYRDWRKNRQPTPGSSSVGTDLNRNYPYKWGCCSGSSGDPKSSRYRGTAPLSAPEARSFHDFVRSRVVGGRQQIRASISFHTTGRLVMYPYGHTTTNITTAMTRDDHSTLVAMARRFAATNGYDAIQASDLYLTSGTSRDWLYNAYRIFAFTFEMSSDSTPYPGDHMIGPETSRNRAAVLELIDLAACPFEVIDLERQRCGAFDDDLEVARGWMRDAQGTDTATGGRWQRGDPAATSASGPKQSGTTTSGIRGLVTGTAPGSSAGANDLDEGTTSITSPAITMPSGAGQRLSFRYTFAHSAAASNADWLRAEILAGGTSTTVWQATGGPTDRDAAWRTASATLDPWAGKTIRIRFSARDGGAGNLVEAAIDDVRIPRP